MAFTRRSVGAAALLWSGFYLHAQEVPGGWKTVKDSRGHCQFAVPADWAPDKLMKSFMNSADGSANAVASSAASGPFASVTGMAKQTMVPKNTIEDSSKRLWYVYETQMSVQKGRTEWYVAVPTDPVCAMQISFKGAAMEDTAKKIALSLTQAK
jgi:hypothetical protein